MKGINPENNLFSPSINELLYNHLISSHQSASGPLLSKVEYEDVEIYKRTTPLPIRIISTSRHSFLSINMPGTTLPQTPRHVPPPPTKENCEFIEKLCMIFWLIE